MSSKKSEGDTKCVACDKPIEGKILSALGKTYHPEHFTCEKCKKPIKDKKFQTHDGEPYCEEDYAKYFLKKCVACKQPIKEKIVKALDENWHEEHFVCATCKKKLSGSSFMAKEKTPYCEKCYHEKFSDRCHDCGKPIAEQAIIALNEKWHQNCFKCLKCKKPVEDQTFQVKDGRPICAKCS